MSTTLAVPAASDRFSPEELHQFWEEGFYVVPGLAEAGLREHMIAVAHEGVDRLIEPLEYEADLGYPGAPSNRAMAGGRTVRRLQQAHARDAVFTRWIQHPDVVTRIRQLLGPDIVCPLAHHNCIMTKHPRFSSETGWHQDIRYWSYQRPELVSVWLALGSERNENGSLLLIPGSHRIALDRSRMDERLFVRTDLPENQQLLDQAVEAPLNAGDVLFFHCRTIHAAGANRTDDPKLSTVFTYRSADNPPVPGSRSASLAEMLIPPGLPSGA